MRKRASEEESHTNFLDDDVAVENDVQDRQEQNLIFFDFECTQDHGEHIPNLCVAQNERGEEFVFSGKRTKDEFCKWVFEDKTQTLRLSLTISRPMTDISSCNTCTKMASLQRSLPVVQKFFPLLFQK